MPKKAYEIWGLKTLGLRRADLKVKLALIGVPIRNLSKRPGRNWRKGLWVFVLRNDFFAILLVSFVFFDIIKALFISFL